MFLGFIGFRAYRVYRVHRVFWRPPWIWFLVGPGPVRGPNRMPKLQEVSRDLRGLLKDVECHTPSFTKQRFRVFRVFGVFRVC